MVKKKAKGLSEPGQRYIPHGIDQSGKAMQTAKLFKNGRSQAVRLPKEFRFEGEEVYVTRRGDEVVLTPKARPRSNPWRKLLELAKQYDHSAPFERNQPKEHQVRPVLDELFPPRRRKAKK
jgi:antitoxin VapB